MIDVFEMMVDLEPIYSSLFAIKVIYIASAVGTLVSLGKIINFPSPEDVNENKSTKMFFILMGWYGIGSGSFSVFTGAFLFSKGLFEVGEIAMHFFPLQVGVGVISMFVLGPVLQKREENREVSTTGA